MLATGLAVLATGLIEAWILTEVGGARTTLWVDDLGLAAAAAIACASCLRAAARQNGRMRLFWSLLGCAAASWTLAEVGWSVYELILRETVPSPSWADLGYLLAIPLAVAALVLHPAISGSGTRKARWLLDGMVVATALLFLSWTLVLGSVWHSANLGTAGGIVTLAYPFGDVVIVFFVVLTIRGMTGANRLSLWCLLAALLAMALTDSAFTYLSEVANYYTAPTGNPIDAGWVAAYLGIALAAGRSRTLTAWAPKVEASRPSLASLVSPLLPVLLALSVAAVQIKLGHHLDDPAVAMAFGLIALVLARQGLLILELRRLKREGTARLSERLTNVALGGLVVEEGLSTDRRR